MARVRCTGVAVTLLVLTCVSCTSASDPPSSAATPPSSSTAPSSPASSPPTKTTPPYLASYSSAERRAYQETLAAYADFTREQVKILAAGKATPQARRYYKAHTADWSTYWNLLQQREADGIQIKGRGETVRVRPAAIRLAKDGTGIVDLRVCGVAKDVKVFQHGEPVPQPEPTPRIVNVRFLRLTSSAPWKVFWERVGGAC